MKTPEFNVIDTPSGWMVSVPAAMTGNGKRKRKFFSSKTAAERFAGRLRAAFSAGIRNAVLPANVAVMAAEAVRVLDGTGLTLLDAARIARDSVVGDGQGETFGERHRRCLLANEGRWRDRYADDMARISRWVPQWFLDLPCGAVSNDTMERALTDGRSLSRSTIDTRMRYLSAVVGHRDRHRRSADIHILDVGACARLLRRCESKQEVWAVALLLFAGIRPDAEHGEIMRLDWSAVGAEEIYVSGEVSKTGSDRHIQILPRLARLLRGHPHDGTVVPANWRRVWRRLRSGEIPQDACRHTYASHLLAWYGGEEGPTQMALGHVAGSRTLFRHYRRSVTIEQGRRFFR